VDLPRTGIEYAKWIVEANVPPEDGVTIALLRRYAQRPTSSTTYLPGEWEGPATTHTVPDPTNPRATVTVFRRVLRLLVAGPDVSAEELAEAAGSGTPPVVLAAGEHRPWIRWDDAPEDVVRRGGVLHVR